MPAVPTGQPSHPWWSQGDQWIEGLGIQQKDYKKAPQKDLFGNKGFTKSFGSLGRDMFLGITEMC